MFNLSMTVWERRCVECFDRVCTTSQLTQHMRTVNMYLLCNVSRVTGEFVDPHNSSRHSLGFSGTRKGFSDSHPQSRHYGNNLVVTSL